MKWLMYIRYEAQKLNAKWNKAKESMFAWFNLYEVLQWAKVTYDDQNQNSGCLWAGSNWLVGSEGKLLGWMELYLNWGIVYIVYYSHFIKLYTRFAHFVWTIS